MLISPCLSSQVLQIALSACGRATFSSKALQICSPVVIVGAGPTGLVLSSLLSQYGEQQLSE
jgi:ribulose 1,5-bisphosphate synthetase/thiazole synthase